MTKKSLIYIIWWIILLFINSNEWHILGLYHNFLLIWILLVYILFKVKLQKSIKIIWIWLWLFLILLLFLYFFKPDYINFIINTFNPIFSLTYLTIVYNQFSYFTEFWLLIILFLISYIFIYKNNNNYKILAIYLIFWAVLFHAYLFWVRLNSFKYLVDFLIILIIIFSIFIISFKDKKIKILILLIFFTTNIYWIKKIFEDEITWTVYYNENSIKDYELCKDYNVIATDIPWRAFLIFWDSKKLYSLPSFNDAYHINNEKYMYLDIHAIRDINHLKNILKDKWGVCFVLSHNVFDPVWKFWNKELFDYVIKYSKVLKEKFITKRPMWTWKYPLGNSNNWVVLVIDNSILDIPSQN